MSTGLPFDRDEDKQTDRYLMARYAVHLACGVEQQVGIPQCLFAVGMPLFYLDQQMPGTVVHIFAFIAASCRCFLVLCMSFDTENAQHARTTATVHSVNATRLFDIHAAQARRRLDTGAHYLFECLLALQCGSSLEVIGP